MPNEMTQQHIDTSGHAWQAPEGTFAGDGLLAVLAWWLTGGLALVAWTGIVLVLTGA